MEESGVTKMCDKFANQDEEMKVIFVEGKEVVEQEQKVIF